MYSVNLLSKAKQSKAKQSKAKQSKAKQSKAKRELYALNNNSFKIFLTTLLSLILLFSISCSNEGTTGGDGGNYNYFSVSEEWSNTNDIVLTSINYSAGYIGFNVYGSTSYSVSIESVANNSGSSLALEPSDFSYDESTKKLTLSYYGLTKFQNASSSLTARQKYQYTITFKFTDYASEDTKNLDVNVNLIKAEVITKTQIENMMKAVKYKEDGLFLGGTPNTGEIIIGDGAATKFSFANETFSSSNPNFKSTGTTSSLSSSSTASTVKASGRKFSLAYAIRETTLFKTYFGSWLDIDYDSTPPTISSGNKDCTFTLKFKKLQSGYALSSEVAHLMTSGLTIRLTLDDKANWQ